MALPIRIEDIKEKVEEIIPYEDLLLIDKAYTIAYAAHREQLRKDGSYYIVHPLYVADILADMKMDAITIAAGLLHDVIEDTEVTEEDLYRLISELDENEKHCKKVDPSELEERRREQAADIVKLVKGVSHLPNVKSRSYFHKRSIQVRDVILAAQEDPRIVFIKLADRLHNMRTLQYMDPEKQKIIAEETLNIYAPMAHLYGLYHMRNELEDLSFKYLYPENYAKLKKVLQEYEAERMPIMEQAREILQEELKKKGVKATVTSRIKHLYGIYTKLIRRGINIENARDVHDIIGLRVIVDDEDTIYNAYSIVSKLWKVVETKDYVSNPKPNGYRSFHVIVIGPEGKKMEVQIRTWEMHEFAEYGFAAHWAYKMRGHKIPRDELQKINQIRKIIDEAREDNDDPLSFRERIEEELKKYQNFIRVFTPKGDQITLPPGSTPIDFAYAIHTEIGNHCKGAKVDGAIKPLNYILKNGETVEILTDKNRMPSYEWLKFAKTRKARNRIRKALFDQEAREYEDIGRSLLKTVLKNYDIPYKKFVNSEEFREFLRREKIDDLESFLILFGRGNLRESHIKKILETLLPDKKKSKKGKGRNSEGRKSSVVIDGFESLPYRFCKTCNPQFGDVIVGYVSRSKRTITVHRIDCPDLKNLDSSRMIIVNWDEDRESIGEKEVRLIVEVEDRPGVLKEISTVTEEKGVNIKALTFSPGGEGKSIGFLSVQVPDLRTAHELIDSIARLKSVSAVRDSSIK